MWRHIASNALTFLIVALFLVAGVVIWGNRSYEAEGPLEQAICLRVESGSNMRRVSEELAEQGAITSPAIFRMGADYSDRSSQLKAGAFRVDAGTSMAEIVDIITRGGANTCGTEIVYRIGVNGQLVQVRELDPATNRFEELARFDPEEEEAPAEYTAAREDGDTTYNVIFAEGITSWQAVNGLNGLEAMSGTVATVPAEGSLHPRAFEFDPGTDPNTIIAPTRQ